jgi:hypothetical protein
MASKGYKLVNTKTGKEVRIGEIVTTFRGEQATLTDWAAPFTPASTGRVYLKFESGMEHGYFPTVIETKIVKVSDD